ncbi:MAG: calcium-binding protein [Paracoccaceae bacterium]
MSSAKLILGSVIASSFAANVTADYFGVVVKAADTDFGKTLVSGSNIDQALVNLGVTSIRYPGGTEARTDFSVTDAADVAGLKRAIDYCAANGLALNFTLNDSPYVDPSTGQASMTQQQRAELVAFLQNDLLGYASAQGVTVESIKIGNEFSGRTADYGSPAVQGYGNVAALLVNEIDSFLNNHAFATGRPTIVVEAAGWEAGADTIIGILEQAGAASKVGGVDLHGSQNGTQGTPTLDLTWDLYFGTANSDEPGVSYQDRLTRIIEHWTSNAATANVALRVDAWCFPTTPEGPALTNAALAIMQLHTFSLVGIASATCYLGYGPDMSSLIRKVPDSIAIDVAKQTTPGGAIFAMMAAALPGTHAIELQSTPAPAIEATDSSLTRAFAGDQQLILYTANRTYTDLAIDIDTVALTGSLEAFIGGTKSAAISILGVTDSAMVADGDGQAQVTIGKLALAQLNAGTTDFTLNAYEISQITLIAAGTFGTAAENIMTGTAGSNVLHGLGGADTLYGGSGSDTLAGGDQSDQLFGGAGKDLLYGGTGQDALDGGSGIDTASYAFATAPVVANLAAPHTNTGDAFGDTYSGIENLEGGQFNDTLTGDTGNNLLIGGAGDDNLGGGDGNDILTGGTGNDWLRGNAGNDSISGGTGDDTLAGGAGVDTMSGGAGNDVFCYYFKSEAGDQITDFGATTSTDDDRFNISAAGFGGGLGTGALDASQFALRLIDNFAQDTSDRFMFRVLDKTLWFDADGSGSGAAVMVANLQDSAANLTAADIWLF